MKVLVVGGGGREHALAWKIAQSPRVTQVFVAPGNAGTATEPRCQNVAIAAEDVAALLKFAREQSVGLTVVGPEGPLAAGIVDTFAAAGLRCFGVSKQAAQLEASKAFAKEFLARHGIPTATYKVHTEVASAFADIEARGAPIVVKADGLAAGKGVVVAGTVAEAKAAVQDMLSGNSLGAAGSRVVVEDFLDGLAAGKGVVVAGTVAEARAAVQDMLAGNSLGAAGSRVVVEDFLDGEEASFIIMAAGGHALEMATSQDHKRVGDGDTGPNTGGMGAYSPAPVVTEAVRERVLGQIIGPTLAGLKKDGIAFTGFLYAGLMIDKAGNPRVLEFNCRLGDPETQPLMMRLKSDLVDLVDAALDQRLDKVRAEWDARPALGVVMAAAGYPGTYRKRDAIQGLNGASGADLKVFHAGTALEPGQKVVTTGGRVLCVCALGEDVAAAQKRAYEGVARITWEGVQYRKDIGYRAIARR